MLNLPYRPRRIVRCLTDDASLSALGQKQTLTSGQPLSALTPNADIAIRQLNVRFVPKADSCAAAKRTLAVCLVLLLDNDRLFSANHFAIAKNDPDSFQSYCLRAQ